MLKLIHWTFSETSCQVTDAVNDVVCRPPSACMIHGRLLQIGHSDGLSDLMCAGVFVLSVCCLTKNDLIDTLVLFLIIKLTISCLGFQLLSQTRLVLN